MFLVCFSGHRCKVSVATAIQLSLPFLLSTCDAGSQNLRERRRSSRRAQASRFPGKYALAFPPLICESIFLNIRVISDVLVKCFVPLAICTHIPVPHSPAQLRQFLPAIFLLRSHFLFQDIIAVFGGAMGAMNIPECWYPGKLDLVANSHNIMHVLVVYAAYQMHLAVVGDLAWMNAIAVGVDSCPL